MVHDRRSPLVIRPMEPGEVELLAQWAAAQGWNPGLNDAACFHAADPKGFFLGLIDDRPCAMRKDTSVTVVTPMPTIDRCRAISYRILTSRSAPGCWRADRVPIG